MSTSHREGQKKYYRTEKGKATQKRYEMSHPNRSHGEYKYVKKGRTAPKLSDEERKESDRISKRKYQEKLRLDALNYYSNGELKCSCCGESHLEFLCIDHINGGGGKHRKLKGNSGLSIGFILKRDGYPEGYRVLCHNCNMSNAFYGYCPHSREK